MTAVPVWVTWADHADVTCWLPPNVQVTVQEATAGPLLVTVMVEVNPPAHWLIWSVTWHDGVAAGCGSLGGPGVRHDDRDEHEAAERGEDRGETPSGCPAA